MLYVYMNEEKSYVYEKSSFYMLEFYKYFHILTSLLTTNKNILFIVKILFKTKIVTQKNSKRKFYSGYCLAMACNISGNTLSLLLFLLHKNSSMYEARKVRRHPCILLSFPLNWPHIFSIVFVWIP